MKNNHTNIIIAIALILMAAVSRILNHEMQWYNLAPVGALGLFCGNVIKDKKYAFLFAILAQFIGDVYLELFTSWPGFYGIDQAFVYASLILITLMGIYMKQPKAWKVLGFSFAASVVFFVVSNLGVWAAIELGKTDINNYGNGFTGLINTYVAAIPFFKNTLISTVAGSIILFGAYYLLQLSLNNKIQKARA